jgi:hypothetical protein
MPLTRERTLRLSLKGLRLGWPRPDAGRARGPHLGGNMRTRRPWHAIVGMLTVLAAGVIGVTAASPAMAAPAGWAYYNEGNPSNCLDANINNIYSNGDAVRLEPCTGGLNQDWYGSDQYPGELVNAMSGLCLDANNNDIHSNGDVVQEWACWDGANQLWTHGSYLGEMVNEASGLCLEANNNEIHTNGDAVDQWSCWDGPNQQWYIVFPAS